MTLEVRTTTAKAFFLHRIKHSFTTCPCAAMILLAMSLFFLGQFVPAYKEMPSRVTKVPSRAHVQYNLG